MSKSKIKSLLIKIVLLAGGISFIVLGVTGLANRKSFDTTNAVITRIESSDVTTSDGVQTNYDVYVAYTLDGKDYESELGYYKAGMQVGDELEILFNPENPEEIQETTVVGGILQIAMGLLCIACDVKMFIKGE